VSAAGEEASPRDADGSVHVLTALGTATPAAHDRVGSDRYDDFLQPDGSTILVIGDAVGHDPEAAARPAPQDRSRPQAG
jgi:hypothetical protein